MKTIALYVTGALFASLPTLHAQTVQTLTHQPPEIPIYGFLLTDGSVLVQGQPGTITVGGVTYGRPNGSLSHWFKLTPDHNGSYLNGTWRQVASAITYRTGKDGRLLTDGTGQPIVGPYTPYAGSGAVMIDGKLALVGGEYLGNNFTFWLTNETTVFDPVSNTWTPIEPPQPFNGQGGFQFFGDSPTAVLPNGTLLVGQKLSKLAVGLDPRFYTWVQYGEQMTSKNDINAEEGWTLLPDGSILTADVFDSPRTERLIPKGDVNSYDWVNQGATPETLRQPPSSCCIPFDGGRMVYNPAGEIGPAILRPDGTVFATGGFPYNGKEGHTAIYTPETKLTGSWKSGPDFQPGYAAGDEFGVLERNGNVLIVGEQGIDEDESQGPSLLRRRLRAARQAEAMGATAATYPTQPLYEFNGTTLSVVANVEAGSDVLPLPTGEVLVMGYNETLFTPANNTYNPAWAPTISSVTSALSRGATYKITGTQFTGLSQACAYGDEFQCATNYPLVRITNKATGHVTYARTHDHSTMAVATGSKPVSTNFDVPSTIETGASTLQVVANGIPSAGVDVTVQ